MKRFAVILLMSIYLVSCLGIGVNRFYCCGKLASVKFSYGVKEDNYASNQINGKKNCCKHEKQSLKIRDSHVNQVPVVLGFHAPAIIQNIITAQPVAFNETLSTKTTYGGNGPPGSRDNPLYILYCTYLI